MGTTDSESATGRSWINYRTVIATVILAFIYMPATPNITYAGPSYLLGKFAGAFIAMLIVVLVSKAVWSVTIAKYT